MFDRFALHMIVDSGCCWRRIVCFECDHEIVLCVIGCANSMCAPPSFDRVRFVSFRVNFLLFRFSRHHFVVGVDPTIVRLSIKWTFHVKTTTKARCHLITRTRLPMRWIETNRVGFFLSSFCAIVEWHRESSGRRQQPTQIKTILFESVDLCEISKGISFVWKKEINASWRNKRIKRRLESWERNQMQFISTMNDVNLQQSEASKTMEMQKENNWRRRCEGNDSKTKNIN